MDLKNFPKEFSDYLSSVLTAVFDNETESENDNICFPIIFLLMVLICSWIIIKIISFIFSMFARCCCDGKESKENINSQNPNFHSNIPQYQLPSDTNNYGYGNQQNDYYVKTGNPISNFQ